MLGCLKGKGSLKLNYLDCGHKCINVISRLVFWGYRAARGNLGIVVPNHKSVRGFIFIFQADRCNLSSIFIFQDDSCNYEHMYFG